MLDPKKGVGEIDVTAALIPLENTSQNTGEKPTNFSSENTPKNDEKKADFEALDTLTRFASPFDEKKQGFVSSETGEIVFSKKVKNEQNMHIYNPIYKWELQSHIREILPSKNRVNTCFRYPISKHNDVNINRHLETDSLFYTGLMVCGQVWLCPICAAKIQRYRAKEVEKAIQVHKEFGGSVYMLTLTVPHKKEDNLKDLLDRFLEAYRFFTAGKSYKKFKVDFDLVGSIKALETTHNFRFGWHVHVHILTFFKGSISTKAAQQFLFKRWISCAVKKGFDKPKVKALSFDNADYAANYVNKMGLEYVWSASDELTKSHTKLSKKGNSPFDLVRQYVDTSEYRYARLFREYEEAFHYKKMLVWSRGLKKHFGIESKEDKEIAQSIGESFEFLLSITADQWRKLRVSGFRGWRGELLEVVREHGYDGLTYYYEAITGEPFILGANTVLAYEWSR